jgi:hypothetical protein
MIALGGIETVRVKIDLGCVGFAAGRVNAKLLRIGRG